jgi:aspartyl protease family protein
MAVPTGLRNLGSEVAGWVTVAIVAGACAYFFTDIQVLTRQLTGLTGSNTFEQTAQSDSVAPSDGFERTVTLTAGDNGHFYSEATVNGREIQVILDTGATGVALTYEDAERIGISVQDRDYTHVSQTANGETRIAPVMIDEIRIGDITAKNVQGFVTEPGKLFQSLLGMSFLGRLSRVDIRGRELVLEQ